MRRQLRRPLYSGRRNSSSHFSSHVLGESRLPAQGLFKIPENQIQGGNPPLSETDRGEFLPEFDQSTDSGVGPLRATCLNRGERAASERPIQASLELDANFAPPPTKTSCLSIDVIHPSPNLS